MSLTVDDAFKNWCRTRCPFRKFVHEGKRRVFFHCGHDCRVKSATPQGWKNADDDPRTLGRWGFRYFLLVVFEHGTFKIKDALVEEKISRWINLIHQTALTAKMRPGDVVKMLGVHPRWGALQDSIKEVRALQHVAQKTGREYHLRSGAPGFGTVMVSGRKVSVHGVSIGCRMVKEIEVAQSMGEPTWMRAWMVRYHKLECSRCRKRDETMRGGRWP